MANDDRGKAFECHGSANSKVPASPATRYMAFLRRREARWSAWRNLPWAYRYPFLRHQAAFPAKSPLRFTALPPGTISRLALSLSWWLMVALLVVAHLVMLHQIPPIWLFWPSHHRPSRARRAPQPAPAPLWQRPWLSPLLGRPQTRGCITRNPLVGATGRHRRRAGRPPSRAASPLRFPPVSAIGLSGFQAGNMGGPFAYLPAWDPARASEPRSTFDWLVLVSAGRPR